MIQSTTPPKVSVIITTYNRADILSRAVRSVLSQTFTDYEIIIVDDCSTDDTQEVIGRFKDSRIRSFRHKRNRGASAARNTGIDNARGEYIAFLDDDDECTPNRLADSVSALDSKPHFGMVYGRIEVMDDVTGARRVPRIQNTHRGRAAFEAALTGISAIAPIPYPCIRASVVRQVGGFDERVPTNGEDALFMASVTQICDAEYVPSIMSRIHVNHRYDRLSQAETPEKFSRFLEVHLLKFGDELRKRPKVSAAFYWASATHFMRMRQLRRAITYMLQGLRAYPSTAFNVSYLTDFGKAFLWYATPARRFRAQARHIRSSIFGRR